MRGWTWFLSLTAILIVSGIILFHAFADRASLSPLQQEQVVAQGTLQQQNLEQVSGQQLYRIVDRSSNVLYGVTSSPTVVLPNSLSKEKDEGAQNARPMILRANDPSASTDRVKLEQVSDKTKWIVRLSTPSVSEAQARLQTEMTVGVTDSSAIEQEQTSFENALTSEFPHAMIKGSVKNVLNVVFIQDVSENDVESIKSIPGVLSVSPDIAVEATLSESVPLINADDVWQLNAQGNPCNTTGTETCLTGKGVTIGIIDTGVDYNHPDLGGCFGSNCKVVGGYDFINFDDDPMDDMGHGTHVAATAAGNGALKGVAPDAKIYAYKVLNEHGSGSFSSVLAGIEASVDPNGDGNFDDHLDIISLSLGAFCGMYDSYCGPDDSLSLSIDNAASVGVVPVIAAGNNWHEDVTIGSPGVARKAITIAASDKYNYLAYFSSGGPVQWTSQDNKTLIMLKPDVSAPGVHICAAVSSVHDSYFDSVKCLDESHISISGTSMATPHVSGVAALLLQKNHSYTPAQIKSVIKNGVVDLAYPELPSAQGTGRIDALSDVSSQRVGAPIPVILPIEVNGLSLRIPFQIISSSNIDYVISYTSSKPLGQISESDWVQISAGALGTGAHSSSLDLDTSLFLDGDYLIRLKVRSLNNGYTAYDYGTFAVHKFEVKETLNNDVVNPKDDLKVSVKNTHGISPLSLSAAYSLDESTWIPLSTNNADLSTILPANSITQTGFFTIRLRITLSNGLIDELFVRQLYADTTLRPGWPIRIDFEYEETPYGGGFYSAGFAEPVVSDLNNDGLQETVVYQGGNPPKLSAYRPDGSLLWRSGVGTGGASGGNLNLPIVANLDNDPYKEIIVHHPNTNSWPMINSHLYAFNHDGSLLWSASVPLDFNPTFLAADLDNDGLTEIVMQGSDAWEINVSVLNSMGQIISEWGLPKNQMGTTLYPSPAVGNFDEDSDLEIVLSFQSEDSGWDDNGNWVNENVVGVYNMDGSLVNGWPIILPGGLSSSPSVGDIDKNGQDDIVIGELYAFTPTYPDPEFGGLYAINRHGEFLSGWPIEKGSEFWSTSALGDIDGDGDLEISAGGSTYLLNFLLNHDGSLLPGWPKSTSWVDYYGSIRGDANGDAMPDVLTTAGSIYECQRDNCGGVYGWKTDGISLNSFPKVTDVAAQAPAVLSDIDKDGKVELIASSDYDMNIQTMMFKERATLYAWNLNTLYNADTMQWPTFQHDVARTGCYNCASWISEGLVAHYPFDTITQGTTPDISYYNQPASVQGAKLTTANKFPNSFVFDGVDDKVIVPHSSQVNLKGAFSVSFWFKGSKTQGPQTFVSKWTGVQGAIAWFADIAGPGGNCPSNSGVDFYVSEDGGSSDRVYVRDCGKIYQDNKLHHFAGVFEPGKKIELYIDGKSVGTVAGNINTVMGVKQNSAPITIGSSGTSSFYKGSMDDVRIYNRALTKQEVTILFSNSPNQSPHKLTPQPEPDK
jgi:subtilisin family serine protease